MLNFNLNVRPQTAKRLKKALEYSRDEEAFAQSIIAYQIAELRRAILNLRLELKTFEEKYRISSAIFHKKFDQGQMDDSEDFILWAGAYELLEKNKERLQGLEG
jgi:Rad3-related DNA helicase